VKFAFTRPLFLRRKDKVMTHYLQINVTILDDSFGSIMIPSWSMCRFDFIRTNLTSQVFW